MATVFGLVATITLSAADRARIVGESRPTAQRLAEAAVAERDGRATAAVDLYLRILDESGGDLVTSDVGDRHLLPARWVVHRRIAKSEPLLTVFRDRVETPAGKLLEAGLALRDSQPLESLVESMFCALPTESALHLLGDLACERGDFGLARRYWIYLSPTTTAGALSYPSPVGDPALPAAKIILSQLLGGDRDGLSDEIDAFRLAHPHAIGNLAGRSGNLAKTLTDLAASPNVRVAAAPDRPSSATTFGNDGSRNGLVRDSFPPFTSAPPFGPVLLPEANADAEGRQVQKARIRPSALAFVPIVHAGHALVADARRVTAINLSTGGLAAQFDLRSVVGSLPKIDSRLPSTSHVQHTLTVAGDTIFVRLGQARIRSDRVDADSYLVALQFRPTLEEKFKLRWLLPALGTEQTGHAIFEGAPLSHAGRLFVAMTKLEGNRAVTAVACYDPGDVAPHLIWQQDVFETGPDAADRSRHLLLTAAGGTIVCGPHAGAVVALDAVSGRRAWAARYDSRGFPAENGDASSYELFPCVEADGRLFVAPADYDRIIALDAMTGEWRWESDPIDTASIIGVADGKVICQLGGYVAGLVALDATTGHRVLHWGYRVFGADSAAPFGRGLVLADCVCWPTRADGVKVLRLNGQVEYAPAIFHSLPGGHLVYGGESLIVATADRLLVVRAQLHGDSAPDAPLGQLRRQSISSPFARREVP
jgi:outer membrane protein assembly factor BamB